MSEFFFSTSVRTDLAAEAVAKIPPEIPGVQVSEEQHEVGHIHRVHVTSPQGAQQIGKLPGRYITLSTEALVSRNREAQTAVGHLLKDLITELLPPTDGVSLVVGLGNWNATPDALGPRVVSKLLVTRHLSGHIPPELERIFKPVAAIAPGVLGLTGIETGDVIGGLVDRIKPARVVVIDALAARDLDRLWRTIQLTDTGIHPGSGVAGGRKPIDRSTLGVPTIALGIPTVVPAVMIAEATVTALADGGHLNESLAKAPGPIRQQMLSKILGQFPDRLLVTPKEVDVQIEDAARVIAGGINLALQPEMSAEDINQYVD